MAKKDDIRWVKCKGDCGGEVPESLVHLTKKHGPLCDMCYMPKSREDIEEGIATHERSLENLADVDTKNVNELRLIIKGALEALKWVLKPWPANRKKVLAMKRKQRGRK